MIRSRSALPFGAVFFLCTLPAGWAHAGEPLAKNSAAPTTSATASSVARSKNFLITAPTQELADQTLARAESLRKEIATDWLGDELPSGAGVAFIHLALNENEDHGLSWIGDKPGETHKVWLSTGRQQALGCTLAHEMVHVVLATQYPGKLPVWAHEGAAGLEDDEATLVERAKMLAWWASSGNWPSLRTALTAKSITPSDVSSYTMAASLAEFLLEKNTKQVYLALATDGASGDWQEAFATHYGYRSLNELQRDWQAWGERRAANAAKFQITNSK